MTATNHSLTLGTALDLPGHETGRRVLVSALQGRTDVPVKVIGHWEHDMFAVDVIADVFDEEENCWASEYGSDLYPMALAG